jgi:hypothetical protein
VLRVPGEAKGRILPIFSHFGLSCLCSRTHCLSSTLVSGHFQSSKAALEVSTEPTGHLALSGSLSGQGQDWWRSEAPPLPTFSVFSTITSGMKAIGHLQGGKFSVAVLISKPPPALLELATTLGVTCWPLAEKREMTLLGHHLVFRNRGNC